MNRRRTHTTTHSITTFFLASARIVLSSAHRLLLAIDLLSLEEELSVASTAEIGTAFSVRESLAFRHLARIHKTLNRSTSIRTDWRRWRLLIAINNTVPQDELGFARTVLDSAFRLRVLPAHFVLARVSDAPWTCAWRLWLAGTLSIALLPNASAFCLARVGVRLAISSADWSIDSRTDALYNKVLKATRLEGGLLGLQGHFPSHSMSTLSHFAWHLFT